MKQIRIKTQPQFWTAQSLKSTAQSLPGATQLLTSTAQKQPGDAQIHYGAAKSLTDYAQTLFDAAKSLPDYTQSLFNTAQSLPEHSQTLFDSQISFFIVNRNNFSESDNSFNPFQSTYNTILSRPFIILYYNFFNLSFINLNFYHYEKK